uniref:Uncharacterized protein n=1 Tax=viral metagenome TaxID=1070528 RepID=A0A6C0C6M6_9ZZZZ
MLPKDLSASIFEHSMLLASGLPGDLSASIFDYSMLPKDLNASIFDLTINKLSYCFW